MQELTIDNFYNPLIATNSKNLKQNEKHELNIAYYDALDELNETFLSNNELFQNAQYIANKSDYELLPGVQIIETPGHSHDSISVIVTGRIGNQSTQPLALTGQQPGYGYVRPF